MSDFIATRASNPDELYHHGVKGMKWGVSKKSTNFQRDGSKRTVEKLNKFLNADKKYGSNRSVTQNIKVTRLYNKYDKSAAKDIRKAVKSGDAKAANSITAGRTFLKMMMDQNYLNTSIAATATRANVEPGKKFTYNFLRDDQLGGVKVKVNGYSDTYSYIPKLQNKYRR